MRSSLNNYPLGTLSVKEYSFENAFQLLRFHHLQLKNVEKLKLGGLSISIILIAVFLVYRWRRRAALWLRAAVARTTQDQEEAPAVREMEPERSSVEVRPSAEDRQGMPSLQLVAELNRPRLQSHWVA